LFPTSLASICKDKPKCQVYTYSKC